MARPERNNVDYFPLYTDNGKKMFFIEQKYGNDGYATWLKILTELAKTDFHYLDLKDDVQKMYLSSLCRIDENTLNSIINDLVKLGEFDAKLWDQNILFSEKFIESIKDAYNKRNNECITLHGLRERLTGLGRIKQSKSESKGAGNTQSIVENSIEEKSKEEESIKEIVDFLNDLANRFYKSETEQTKKLISARLKNYTIEQLKEVIQLKCYEWMGTDMERFIRPSTLFNRSNFENYIEEVENAKRNPQLYKNGRSKNNTIEERQRHNANAAKEALEILRRKRDERLQESD